MAQHLHGIVSAGYKFVDVTLFLKNHLLVRKAIGYVAVFVVILQ